jgi:hypothetical protein
MKYEFTYLEVFDMITSQPQVIREMGHPTASDKSSNPNTVYSPSDNRQFLLLQLFIHYIPGRTGTDGYNIALFRQGDLVHLSKIQDDSILAHARKVRIRAMPTAAYSKLYGIMSQYFQCQSNFKWVGESQETCSREMASG